MGNITIRETAKLAPVDIDSLDTDDKYIDSGREIRSVSSKGYVTYTDGTTRPPRKYETPDSLESAIDDYYDNLPEGKAPTLSGLMLGIGIYNTSGLEQYSRISPEYKRVIKKAYLRYVNYVESELSERKTNAGGLIFVAKNRLGWKDQVEHSHTGEVKHSVIMIPAESSIDDFNGRVVSPDAGN